MSTFIRLTIVILATLFLAACAAVPQQTFNKQAHAKIKTIALIQPPAPKEYIVNIVNHPGYQFGLLGGLAAAAELSSKTERFTVEAKKAGLDISKDITTALKTEMEKAGYQVIMVEQAKAEADKAERTDFLQNYPTTDPKPDAYLDVVFRGVGYSAQHPSTPYEPALWMPARLVDAQSKEVLYSTLLICGAPNPVLESTHVSPDSTYNFDTFDSLISGHTKAAEGLRVAAQSIARQIAADLK